MDLETARYLMTYYARWLTENEAQAVRHQTSKLKLGTVSTDTDQRREAIYLKKGWLSTDPAVLSLLVDGYESFEIRTASRMLQEQATQIYLNNCPRCGRLARTPMAKQCRFCGYDWH